MKTKILCLLAALVLLFSGCSRIVRGEYYSETDHTEKLRGDQNENANEIYTYDALRKALLELVSNCAEHGAISISERYIGADAVDDMSRACLEVTRQTAMGTFAVDYMTHAYTKDINGYDMEVYITYKRTPEQIFSAEEHKYLSTAMESFDRLIAERGYYLVLKLESSVLTEKYLNDYLDDIYFSGSGYLTVRPELEVETFTESGSMLRIVEIRVRYGSTADRQEMMYTELLDAREKYVAEGESDVQKAVDLALKLHDNTQLIQKTDGYGSTAYGALVAGAADSEGLAIAYRQLCSDANIECVTVRGTSGGQEHFWNIVTLGGEHYHFDVSELYGKEAADALLKSDLQRSADREWDREKYPNCAGSLTWEKAFPVQAEEEILPE